MNVEAALERLGLEYTESGNEAIALCPMHKQRTGREDSKPSFSVNIRTGVFQCFSCGYRGHLLRLIRDMLDLSDYRQAEDWLGGTLEPEKVVPLLKARLLRSKRTTRITVRERPVSRDAEFLSFYEADEKMAASRGLTVETCRLFDLRMSGDRWIIPIRDPDGALVGWQEKGFGHFRNVPPGVRKGSCLFGYELLEEGATVVVVESPLDAALAVQAGHPAVATYGATVSNVQKRLLSQFFPVLALDNDNAGITAQRRLSTALSADGVRHRVVRWPDDLNDFGDDPSRITEVVATALDPLKARLIG